MAGNGSGSHPPEPEDAADLARTAGAPAGAVDRVYTNLRAGILDGTYPEGARLGEVELAEALGVSRTPVREALRRLGSEGLVETLPNKGARVRTWTKRELDAITDLRALVESHAAALAAPRITDAELEVMAGLLEQMEDATADPAVPDYDRLTAANERFHAAVIVAAGNPLLPDVARSFTHVPIMVRTFRLYTPERLLRSMRQHRELHDALTARDAAWAEAVMRAHILSARPVLLPAAQDPPA